MKDTHVDMLPLAAEFSTEYKQRLLHQDIVFYFRSDIVFVALSYLLYEELHCDVLA